MHVMIDLETADSKSNAAIVAIGAVVFDHRDTYATFYTPIDLNSAVKCGGTIGANTLAWWMQQPDEARAVFHDSSALSLHTALQSFAAWLEANAALRNQNVYRNVCVWGNGATFDNVILSNSYEACGLPKPWSYHNDMCFRTMRSLFPQVDILFNGVKHNALDDARNQALHLIACAKCSTTLIELLKR